MDKKTLTDNFANNLELERLRLNLSQAQMANSINLSLSSYKRLINGETEKIDICTAVNLYLLTQKLAFEFLSFSNPQLDVIKKIHQLSPFQLSFIDNMIDFELSIKPDTKEKTPHYITVIIPTGDMKDNMIYDSANFEKLDISSYSNKIKSHALCGIKVTSNHLHPVYNIGDILIIQKTPIRHGDTGIFINTETQRIYIRKFIQSNPCKLVPINDYGETFSVYSDDLDDMNKWIKFGHVICKIR